MFTQSTSSHNEDPLRPMGTLQDSLFNNSMKTVDTRIMPHSPWTASTTVDRPAPKGLFSTVDTSTAYHPLTSEPKSTIPVGNQPLMATPSTSAVPSQPAFNQSTIINQADPASNALRDSVDTSAWLKPPSFFTVESADKWPDMDADLVLGEYSSTVPFGEGKSILVASEHEATPKSSTAKRNSVGGPSFERRVSLKFLDDNTAQQAKRDKGKGRAVELGHVERPIDTPMRNNAIHVFGISNIPQEQVLSHFKKYGEIIDVRPYTGGNWLTLFFASDASAEQALQSNGARLTGNCMIGVVMGPQQNSTTQHQAPPKETPKENIHPLRIVPLGEAKDLYKQQTKKPKPAENGIGLGSGKAGLSVLSCPNVSPEGNVRLVSMPGLFKQVKDFLLEW